MKTLLPTLLLVLSTAGASVLHGYDASFLWRIETEPPSFLFGTIHVSDPRVLDLPSHVLRALDRADAVFGEIAGDRLTEAEWVEIMMLGSGQSARTLLGEELWARLDQMLRSHNPLFSAQGLNGFKVWAIGLLVYELSRAGIEDPNPDGGPVLDDFILTTGEEAGKRIGGLETPREQLGSYDRISLQGQIDMVEDLLDYLDFVSVEDRAAQSAARIDAYLTGDEPFVAELTRVAPTDPPYAQELDAQLVVARNHLMAERILAELAASPQESFFFAVGAGHYIGTDTIQDILRAEGYRITRVPHDWYAAITADRGHGWRELSWLGWFWAPEYSPWAYHLDHGWIHPIGNEQSQWIYLLQTSRWIWTGAQVHPWAYDYTAAAWVILGE